MFVVVHDPEVRAAGPRATAIPGCIAGHPGLDVPGQGPAEHVLRPVWGQACAAEQIGQAEGEYQLNTVIDKYSDSFYILLFCAKITLRKLLHINFLIMCIQYCMYYNM